MICLYCEEPLVLNEDDACSNCGVEHATRPPVVGINHISQLLDAVDAYRDEEIDSDTFGNVLEVFSELLQSFEAKWNTGELPLEGRLSSSLAPRFQMVMRGFDEAISHGFKAIEILESLVAEPSEEGFQEAESELISFFTASCSNGAKALAELDTLMERASTSGALINISSG